MKLEKIFEDENFIIYKDNKGYDFAYDIENKNKTRITIEYGEYNEKTEIGEWIGLFESEKNIIESITNQNYKVI